MLCASASFARPLDLSTQGGVASSPLIVSWTPLRRAAKLSLEIQKQVKQNRFGRSRTRKVARGSEMLELRLRAGRYRIRIIAQDKRGRLRRSAWLSIDIVRSPGSTPTPEIPDPNSPPQSPNPTPTEIPEVTPTPRPTPVPGPPLTNWTSFTLHPEARRIYVSSSIGNDANDGFSAGSAVQSLTVGIQKIRPGFGDWLLLRKGDEWVGSFDNVSALDGRSSEYPTLISSYGTGARPLIKVPATYSGINVVGGSDGLHFFALVGIDFYSFQRDPDSPDWYSEAPLSFSYGIQGVFNGSHFLVEDCRFRYFSIAISFSGGGAVSPVTLRRNIIIDSYGIGHSSQGLFTSAANDLVVDENIFDHNGHIPVVPVYALGNAQFISSTRSLIVPGGFTDYTWQPNDLIYIRQLSNDFCGTNVRCNVYKVTQKISDHEVILDQDITTNASNPTDVWVIGTAATKYNHNIYFSNGHNITFRGNILSRGASHGAQVRPGGLVEDNLFTHNAYSFFVGRTESFVRNNVVLSGREISELDPGGDGIGVNYLPYALVENNIVANILEGATGTAISVGYQTSDPQDQSMVVEIRNNVAWNWKGIGFGYFGRNQPTLGALEVVGNDFQMAESTSSVLYYRPDLYDPLSIFTLNRYHAPGTPVFHHGNYALNFAQWSAFANDDSSFVPVSYPDPDRSLARYHAEVIGGAGSFESFIGSARELSRDNWNALYSASAVNDYIRAGFGR